MYDPVCKFLVENFSADFANWLLGEPVSLSTLSPTELSLEPIRADAMILLETQQSVDSEVLHLEFQTNPEAKIPFRMLNYWVRIRHRYPKKSIRQVVIYLRRTNSAKVYQDRFQEGHTSHQFEIVRLWEQPFEAFLKSPGLLPFAVLSRIEDPTTALERVVTQIRTTLDPQMQKSISTSVAILAGLVLEESLIERIVGMELLAESTVYQGIKRRAVQEEQQATRAMVLRILNRKIGSLPSHLESEVKKLPIEQTRALNEAILDFENVSDLENWLASKESNANDSK